MSRVLAVALARLSESDGTLAATAFTPAQRRALNEFAQKTNVLRVKTVGRGSAYQVIDANTLAGHLRSLRPMHANDIEPSLPNRAANIAGTRNSKGAGHGHELHYLLVKAVSDEVSWEIQRGDDVRVLDLSVATETAGAGVLAVSDDDGWRSEQSLWLVENQALFDRLDWMPADATGTVAYYAGQLPARLLKWIAARQRAPQVILFPDYDGVGLLNYARLREVSPGPCSFWLMPDWQTRLRTFGSQQIWKNTQVDFQSALTRLQAMGIEAELAELCQTLSVEGLALEHESVWLSVPADG